MGYRSEVKIAIQCNTYDTKKLTEKAKAMWKTFICEIAVNPDTKIAYEELTSPDRKNCGIGKYCLYYDGEYVKWYDSYTDVQSWMALLEVAKGYKWGNTEEVFSTAFTRIGEEDNDVETDYTGEGHELLSVETSSAFHGNFLFNFNDEEKSNG
tara:strand:+ start:21 stop:479 length:459 start_codon:yes stop_codon:yes gene_type:complete